MWEVDYLFKPPADDWEHWKPDWKKAADVCERLMRQCKHVKLALVFAGIRMEKEGLTGLRDGLVLLAEWLERYWDNLYPQIDTGATNLNERFLQRVNELRNLVSRDPEGIAVLRWLDDARVVRSRAYGSITVRAMLILHDFSKRVEGEKLPDIGGSELTRLDLAAAFDELLRTSPELWKAQEEALTECLQLVTRIDEFVTLKTGPGLGINCKPLEQVLLNARKCFDAFRGTSEKVESETLTSAVLPVDAAGTTHMAAPSGKITSRDGVLQAIRAIGEYYRHYEPSSPVPILMDRAARFAQMGFVDIFAELAPDAATEARRQLGVLEKKEEEKPKEKS